MIQIDIIVPTLNENKLIETCIKSILNFTIPDDVSTKLIFVDGGSKDGTINKIKKFQQDGKNIFLISNPKRIQSTALNLAIDQSNADFIMRLDAHSIYPKDYLIECLSTSLKRKADNVGGVLLTKAGGKSIAAKLVQEITSNSFGVGNSNFRIGSVEKKVDTVPFGFFRRKIFDEIGKFNEKLVRAQDYEFNRRIIFNGGSIWINPKIKIKYYNQPSFYAFLKKIFFLDAPYNSYMWFEAKYSFSFRHSITLFFSTGIIFGPLFFLLHYFFIYFYLSVIFIYIFFNLLFSMKIFLKNSKEKKLIFFLPFSFFIFHFAHGMGVFFGILNMIRRKILGKYPVPLDIN